MAAALNINLLLENINNMISELNLPGYYPLRLSSIIERLQEQYGDEVDLNDLVLQELNESSEYYSKLIQIKNILESLGLEGEFGNVINALQENMTNILDASNYTVYDTKAKKIKWKLFVKDLVIWIIIMFILYLLWKYLIKKILNKNKNT